MPVFEIQTPDGTVLEVDAANADAAHAAALKFNPPSFDQRFQGQGGKGMEPAAGKNLQSGLETYAENNLGRPTKTTSFLAGAGQGVLMNWGDELASGINAGVDWATGNAPEGFGAAYDKRVESARQQFRDVEAANPRSFLAGEVAGGLATTPALPGGGGILGGMKAGAAYGAASGAGGGEGIAGKAVGGAIGGATGAVVGAAVPAAIDAGAWVARQTGGRLASNIRAAVNPTAEAERQIGAARAADVSTGDVVDDATVAAARANGQPFFALDAGGEATRDLARQQANRFPEARSIMNAPLDERFETQQPRATEFIKTLTGTSADAGATKESLQQAARKANDTAYKRAYAQGQSVWDPTLAQIAESPAVQAEIKDATRRSADKAASQGSTPIKNPFTVNPDGTVSLPPGVTPTLEFWDVVKQSLDDRVDELFDKGRKGEGQVIKDLRDALRSHLDRLVPDYQTARRGAAQAFGAEDALQAGREFVRSSIANNDARRAVAKMSAPEKQLFAEGFANDLVEQINRAGDRRSIVNVIFNSPQSKERVEIALGKTRAREFEVYMRAEGIMDASRRALQGNSTTTRQILSEIGFVGAGAGASMYSGDYKGAAAGLLAAGLSRGRYAVNANVGRKIAEMLVSDDPAVFAKATRVVGRDSRLLGALKEAEDYIIRGLGPVADENVSSPLELRVRPNNAATP